MASFLGRILRYLLWLCLLVLLGAFFFGLIKFKGNFVEYVQYLNTIEVKEVFPIKFSTENLSKNQLSEDEIFNEALLEAELSDSLDDSDYFLSEESLLDDNSDFGFSGSLENNESIDSQETSSPSISKEDLVNLIKSNEK